jgi:hypothetical protein
VTDYELELPRPGDRIFHDAAEYEADHRPAVLVNRFGRVLRRRGDLADLVDYRDGRTRPGPSPWDDPRP